jgi:hypothetical protein
MNIRDTFLKLTSQTYPYGYEESLTRFLPFGYKKDEDGNYFYEVGHGSKTIFTSHLDTACKNQTKVTHRFDGKFIRTNGTSILGADDKAGVTILLYLIYNKVPGLYYFFIGEECGCIGSTAASKRFDFFSKYNMMVSFDRRGTNSIITHQSSRRTCSDEFAKSLSTEFVKFGLKMNPDDTGVYTDSAEFVDSIPECTNISVGYYNEHTFNEHQDIDFLTNLAEACVKINWNSLEIKRDCTKKEYKEFDYSDYHYYGGSRSYSDSRNSNHYGGYGGFYGDGGHKKTRRRNKKKNYELETCSWWSDEEYYGRHEKSRDFYYHNGKKVYYDDIEDEMMNPENNPHFQQDLFSSTTNRDHYKGLREMYLDETINRDEFTLIKQQCLNMLDATDKEFAEYLDATLPM